MSDLPSLDPSDSASVCVLLFAAAKDLAGTDRLQMSIPLPATVSSLKCELLRQAPSLQSISASLLWAVNYQYVGDNAMVSAGDEVACFPPVSGG
jgi:molybdopterin synthase sulfur carrier subunit